MNSEQAQFLNYMLDHTKEEYKQDVQDLLLVSFQNQQADEPMSQEEFEILSNQLLSFIREEDVRAVNHAIEHYGYQLM